MTGDEGLLRGVRVVEIGQVLAAPMAAMALADLGATVIKIEKPHGGDPSRGFGPPFFDGSAYYFHSVNRNKKSVVLDLASAAGRQILYALLKTTDVVIHNHVQPVAEKLGIDEVTIRRIIPEIAYVQIGAHGGDKSQRSLDMLIQAEAGAMALTGWDGSPPVKSQVPIADVTAGLYAAVAALAALRHKYTTGMASSSTTSLFGSVIASLPFHWGSLISGGQGEVRYGNAHAAIVPYNTYKTYDGNHIALAAVTERQWRALTEALQLNELFRSPDLCVNSGRLAARSLIDEAIASKISNLMASETIRELTAVGVPAAQVKSMEDVYRSNGDLFTSIGSENGQLIPVPASPIKVAGTNGAARSGAPRLGQHSRPVLADVGFSSQEIDSFIAAGVVGVSSADSRDEGNS
jgi:crotonobetainyl-CoA:carnitine CoA-transferase CaiB-like acyl-CoA transferase